MPQCRICQSRFEPFIDFGDMPIANGFLLPEEYDTEFFFRMQVGYCPKCTMVQLVNQPDREMMFHDSYAYFSSISTRMAQHFEEFAKEVREGLAGKHNPFVVELGSNDGIMLRHFAEVGVRHLGVEPSANVAEAARERGVNTVCEFFDKEVARKIRDEYGFADAILAANVMCHIPYLHSVVDGFCELLAPDGKIFFEDPYLGDIVEQTSYDQIYDEHVFYFSVSSVEQLFSAHGMEVVDALAQNVHGGSMRYVIARKGTHPVSEAVAGQKAKEDALGLKDMETYYRFRRNVEASREALMGQLNRLRGEGRRVVGYGATSKSTTVTMYCGITSEHVEFISDTTPTKQGKFTPGAHIPVKAYDGFKSDYPDVALLFAWNHGEEIMAKETAFRKAGGKWLVYVPKVDVL